MKNLEQWDVHVAVSINIGHLQNDGQDLQKLSRARPLNSIVDLFPECEPTRRTLVAVLPRSAFDEMK